MNSKYVGTGIILGLLAFAGCSKKEEPAASAPAAVAPVAKSEPAPKPAPPKPEPPKPVTVEVVKEKERSAHFTAVNRELELGGTLYAYADVDGDAQKFAKELESLLTQMSKAQPMVAPFVKDYGPIFTALGLNDIKALGVSSVPEGDGYFRNRAFFYTGGERHGLLTGFGGAPAPFARLSLAPPDTDIYSESEIDLPAVYATIRDVVGKVSGEKSAGDMEEALKNAGQSAAISALSVIQNWKGHMALVGRFDREKTLKLPVGNITLPAFSLLISIDGLAPAVKDALAKSTEFSMRKEGDLELYEVKEQLPVESIKPVFAIDGSTLIFATSPAFITECRQQKTGLAQQPEFQKAIARLGNEGNGLLYVSPWFFTRLRQVETLNPNLPAEMKQTVHLVLAKVPETDRALVSVRTNLPEGILVRSYWNRSLKQDVAMIAVYNPVTIGFLAAMAIPAFEKVRTASQEKVVLNNLRQLSAAADQYYLENGVTTATYDQLVGPDKYIREITPANGENYESMVFKQGEPLKVRLRSGKVVRYAP